MIRQKERFIEVTEFPTLIVGQCPGRQRREDTVDYVFHGNRTGDFIEMVIEGKKNIILTNVVNYYEVGKNFLVNEKILQKGINELSSLIEKEKPYKIICLGNYAINAVKNLEPKNAIIYAIEHPSYVLRFQKDVNKYTDFFKLIL